MWFLIDHRQALRQAALENLRRNHDFLADWEEKGRIEHAKNQARKREAERAELRFELAVKEKRERKIRSNNTLAAHDVVSGIDEFEKTLSRLGADSKPAANSDDNDVPSIVNQVDESPMIHLQTLKSMLPNPKAMEEEARLYLRKVSEKKAEEVYARKERERRRRKAMLEQQSTQATMDAKRRDELLAEKLLRQSAQERRLAARLAQTRMHKEVIKENRLVRERQYAAQRQRDYEDVLARDAEIGRQKRIEAQHAIEVERARRSELEAQRQAEKSKMHYALCTSITRELVDLALHVGEQRMLSDAPVPAKEWREWKTLFVRGDRILPEGQGWGEAVKDEDVDLDGATIALDEQALSDYLQRSGEWSEGSGESEGANTILGMILHSIDNIVNPPVPKELPPKLPQSQLKVVLVGLPFAGKSVQAAKLCEKYGLTMIEPVQLLQRLMDAAPFEPDNETSGLSPFHEEFNHLKHEAAAALQAGAEVTDEILAGIISLEIRMLSFNEIFEEGTGWKLQVKTPDTSSGWVLENFPATAAQAELLEKQLSGIDADTVAGPPAESGPKALMAPAPPPPPQPPLLSAVDTVIRLQLSDELATERAAARRVDPETGTVYHMLNNPPPEDEALKERLQPVQDPSYDEAQLLHRFQAYHDEAAGLEAWFEPFGTLRSLDASTTDDQLAVEIEAILQNIVDSKSVAEKCDEEPKGIDASAAEDVIPEPETDQEPEPEAEPGTELVGEQQPEPELDTAAPLESEETLSAAAEQQAQDEHVIEVTDPRELTPELAAIFHAQWSRIEQQFKKRVQRAFRAVRSERMGSVQRAAQVKKDFLGFLRRPDQKTSIVESWQLQFNDLDMEMRVDAETKQELHLRATELRDELWNVCDSRKQRSEEEIESIREDLWVRDHTTLIQEFCCAVIQAECDRYTRTRAIIADYYAERGGEDGVIAQMEDHVADVTGAAAHSQPAEEEAANTKSSKDKKSPAGEEQEVDVPDDELCPAVLAAVNLAKALIPFDSAPPEAEAEDEGMQSAVKKLNPFEIEMKEAMQREDAIFAGRTHRLLERARAWISDLKDLEEHTLSRLDEWLGNRFAAEVGSVKALHKYVQEVIETGQQLHYRMELLSEDAIVDEESLIVALPDPPRPPTPVEQAQDTTFTIDQLEGLSAQVRQLAGESALASSQQVALLLARLAASPENVPASWVEVTADKLQANLCQDEQVVDIRGLLVSLGLQSLPPASANDLAVLKQSLVTADGDHDGKVVASEFHSAKFWFSDLNAAFPRADRMKDYFFTVLSQDGLLSIDEALLFLCFDSDGSMGIRKAFSVYGYDDDVEEIGLASLQKIFHHGQKPETPASPFAKSEDMFSLDALQAAMMGNEKCSFDAFMSGNGASLVNSNTHYVIKSV
eukprot:SAG31_NODE_481_length_15082_cov_13.818728_4_plen_1394_part_00